MADTPKPDDVTAVLQLLISQRGSAQANVAPADSDTPEMDTVHLTSAPNRELTMQVLQTLFNQPGIALDSKTLALDMSFANTSGLARSEAQVKDYFFDTLAEAARDPNMLAARITAASGASAAICRDTVDTLEKALNCAPLAPPPSSKSPTIS